jgi:chitinase
VVLNGSGSGDPDGTIASYNWAQTQGTSVVLTGANTASPSFTAPNNVGALAFRLTVTDNRGAAAVDDVTVDVFRK